MFKKVNLVLISIFLIFSFVLPLAVSAKEVNWPLKQNEVVNLLDIIRKEPLAEANFDLFFESIRGYEPDSPRKTGAVVLVKQTILKEQFDYWFKQVPKQLSIKFIKIAFKVIPLIYSQNISTIIGVIEKLSVEKATDYAIEWLLQNEIKIGSGELSYSFYSYKGNRQEIKIQYIIVYHSLGQNRGKIIAEFYSKNPIEPPENRGSLGYFGGNFDWITSTCWPRDHWLENERKRNNDGKLEPFIVRVKGYVTKNRWGRFKWDDNKSKPIVEIDFDNPVPEIENSDFILENPPSKISFAKEMIDSLLGKLKSKTEGVKDFFTEKGNAFKDTTTNLFDIIIGYFSSSDPEAQIAEQIIAKQIKEGKISPLPGPASELTLEFTKEEISEVKEILEQVLEEIPEETPEKPKPTLKEIAEKLDKLSKATDALMAQTQELLAKKSLEQSKEEKLEEEETEEEPEKTPKEVVLCSLSDVRYPAMNKVIFNEIAWMGTKNSSNDEWLELRNITGSAIDLNDWQILDKATIEGKTRGIKIIFENATISSGGLFLLERTDDTSVPNISADLIYTGSLSNTNETLYLFDPNCTLQDKAEANPNWPAGNNSSKKTMERKTNFGWQTSKDDEGTPKAKNSSGYYESPEEIISKSSTGSSPPTSDTTPEPSSMPKLLISEIQIESEKGVNDEFIEIYNPNNTNVSLKWWSIQKATASGSISKKNFESGNVILAKGYFLIVNKYATQSLLSSADMKHDSFRLASNNTIFLVKNHDYIISGKESSISDKVGWRESFSPEGISTLKPSVGQTIGRKWLEQSGEYQDTNNNSEDFEIQTPTPKAKNQSPAKDTTPPIAQAGSDQTVEINQPVSFDGSSSTDDIGIVSFKWDIDASNGLNWENPDSTSSNPTFESGYSATGIYMVTLQVVDEAGNIATDTLTITVNSSLKILISEIQTEGPTSTKDEFIELYNPNSFTVDLSNFSLKKKTSSGSESNLVSSANFSGTIASLGYFLILPQGKENGDLNYSGKTYSIAKNNTILLYSKYNNLIDKVGFGQAQDFEQAPVQNHPKNYSLGRKWLEATNKYQDTNNNSEDFEIQIPTPQAQNEKDLTSPVTTIISGPPFLTNQVTAIFSFSSNEEGSTFQCKIDSEDWENCSSPTSYKGLAASSHTFYVKAIDLAGNEDSTPAEHTWTIDITIESLSLSLIDLNSSSTSYTNEQMVKVEISQDEEAVAWFLSEEVVKPAASTAGWLDTKPVDFTLSSEDGNKTVYVWTKDAAENVSQLGNSASILLDTIPPQTAIDELPADSTNQIQALFSFSSNEVGSTFQCKLDTLDWENCSSSISYTNLAEGPHFFYAKAIDRAGNYTPTSSDYSWLIDITSPSSQVESLATSSTSTNFTVRWSGSDTSSGILNYDIQYYREDSAEGWQNLAIATSSTSTEFTGQDEQTYYFRSRARDIAGNEESWPNQPDTSIKIEIPKDETPPSVVSDLKAETGTSSGEIILSWTTPGDDGNIGQASEYIIKYGPEGITEDNWASSTIVENLPLPQPAGNEERFIVSDLSDNTLYYFALKAKDESENLSEVSNSPMAKTLNQPPVAMFSYQPENPQVKEEILFDASDSYDSDGLITFYIWDFGDDGSATTSLATTTYIFNTAGQFQIILLVKDDEGTSSEPLSAVIEIVEKPKLKILISEVQIKDKEFVELYNFGQEPVSTTDLYLSYFSANKNWSEPHRNWQFSATATIPAQSFYLIGVKDYPEENGNPNADWQVLTQKGNPYSQSQLSNERGSVGIFSCDPSVSTNRLAENCKIDLFTWQEEDATTTLVFEGNPFSFNENDIEEKSLQRRKENENYIDTDDNSTDFEINYPTPTNSQGEKGNVQPPYPIQDFQVASSIDNTVILTWSTTTDPDTPDEYISYFVYFSKNEEITEENIISPPISIQIATTTLSTLTLDNLYYDSIYYFGIRSFDKLHYSSVATTSHSIPLPPISDLNAGTSALRKTIDLFWVSPGTKKYLIKYAEKEIVENSTSTDKISWGEATLVKNSIVPEALRKTESFSVENLTPNKTYYFAVKSISEKNATSAISNSSEDKSIPEFQDNGDSTITDLYTGLVWIKDGTSPGANNGQALNWNDAKAFCDQLNFAGYNNWRLPNFKELASIIHYHKNTPTIYENYFINTTPSRYWTSSYKYISPIAYVSPAQWKIRIVDFNNGSIKITTDKNALYYIRPVRGPDTQAILQVTGLDEDPVGCGLGFQDNEDETVTDLCTNLTWTKNNLSGIGYVDPVMGGETGVVWKKAIEVAESSNFAGYSDWRLPNVREFVSIAGIVLSGAHFQWSSTPDYFNSNNQWFVNLSSNPGISDTNSKTMEYYVRLVREP